MKTIKKGILTLAVATCLSLGLSVSAAAAETTEAAIPENVTIAARPQETANIPLTALTPAASEVTVAVNGEAVGMETPAHAYEGTTFVAAGSMVRALYPDAVTVCTAEGVDITARDLFIRIRVGQDFMELNGELVALGSKAIMTDAVVMVPLRTLCEALEAQVEWDAESQMVLVTSKDAQMKNIMSNVMKNPGLTELANKASAQNTPMFSGSKNTAVPHSGNGQKFVGGNGSMNMGGGYNGGYTEDDVYWLSRIIEAESGNQSMDGKIGVGNVIMNRVESDAFPDTVEGVIFQGSQFSTVSNGSIYNEPSAESVEAARQVLAGSNTVGDALYFNNTTNCWAGNNRTLTSTIGGHYFFA